jgi:putative ABC transport system substrate-binding protein
VRRREFITLLGGAAAALPLAARAQQQDRMRRIGVLMPQAESDPEQRSWTTAFATRLRELGWRQGENAQIDYRWLGGDTTRAASLAKELVDLQPDVILAARRGTPAVHTRHTDRLHAGFRSGRCWLGHQLGASRRQYHRVHRL